MDSAFIFSKYVSGKNFLGRKNEANILANLLSQGENATIYDAPKTGKTSLIQQAFYLMKSSGKEHNVALVEMMDIRSVAEFATRMGTEVLRCACSSPEEYRAATGRYLSDTHFVFDEEQYRNSDKILSLNWDIDNDDLNALFALPYRLGEEKKCRIVVLLNEFQNVMQTEDGDMLCKLLENRFKSMLPEEKAYCSYLFVGSKINAMHEIFGIRRYFYRNVERVELTEIEVKEIMDYVARGFLASGKVIDRDLLLGVCKLFRNNPFYINHFASICDSMTRGYIMEPILNAALNASIALNETRFKSAIDDLTTFQISLLRAILDGHTKFTSSEIIDRYKLNSSANVRRLKDALAKKEIVFFEDSGEVRIIDPLFEYWVRTFYFKMGI